MYRNYKRTDLASECRSEEAEDLTHGFEYNENIEDGFCVSVFDVLDEGASKHIGKPCGRYITFDVGRIWTQSDERINACASLLGRHITKMMTDALGDIDEASVLICGLGNRYITCDALGSEAVKRIIVTRHLKEENEKIFRTLGGKAVSALAPGVIGQTGIETLELIRGAVRSVEPDIVIVIDALAASELSHLANTVQITDTGISPGSGIGNKRLAVNSESLDCPVIAIGVPTVVESSTLVYAALKEAGISDIDQKLIEVLENRRGFFVTPKESDIIIEELASLIAEAVNTALS